LFLTAKNQEIEKCASLIANQPFVADPPCAWHARLLLAYLASWSAFRFMYTTAADAAPEAVEVRTTATAPGSGAADAAEEVAGSAGAKATPSG
jgi:hypothetical protein